MGRLFTDITYCINKKCNRVDCRRHFNNICKEGLYSVCEFNEKNEEVCNNYFKSNR